MSKELPKAYVAKEHEDKIYQRWEESGFFNPDNLDGEPYSIMMPPPNVTGILHLGHALENSLMDIMVRYQRMKGKRALLVPGTDHAAVATQVKVEKILAEQGLANPRKELGRDKLVERIRIYAEESKSTILSQIRKMGTSCDWSRIVYTFDEQRNRAVNEIFVRMYNDGLIYRGKRMINWSVGAQSVLSDDELEWEERNEPFYYIRCGEFIIGTVRPETKCADSPLVVHPTSEYVRLEFVNKSGKKDHIIVPKYLFEHKEIFGRVISRLESRGNFTIIETIIGEDLAGREFEFDTYAGRRKFKLIADEVIDIEKGAGAMTISSAHSVDDYDLAMRRGLDETFITKIDFNGRMTKVAGTLAGATVEEARKKSVAIMEEKGLIVGVDDRYVHRVPLCYRSHTIVEPMISRQWFVAVNKEISGRSKTLKDLMKEAVQKGHNGDEKQRVTITPERLKNTYFHWIDNLRDWCISRQIWWGHRIPVWYCENAKCKIKNEESGVAAVEEPSQCPNCGGTVAQDPDTLDTWFSSGTWTFSSLGWPAFAKTATAGKLGPENDLANFHPTSWMQMGYEILFFWMARMILMSTYVLDRIPFKAVYIHGLLRNLEGKKFSKSDGNALDPLVVVNEYGADALRYSVVAGITPGNDSKFYIEKIAGARNLVTKLWNIARYMLRHIDTATVAADKPAGGTLADQWILQELDKIIYRVSNSIDSYNFSFAVESLRDFTWGVLADWYLEIAKIENEKSAILNYILNTLLKLWHPYMPFVTEAIWQEVYGKEEMLMVEKWPPVSSEFSVQRSDFEMIKDVVIGIRSMRADYKIEPAKRLTVSLSAGQSARLMEENRDVILGLGRLEDLVIGGKVAKPEGAVGFVAGGIEVFVDLAGVADREKEKARIKKEIDHAALVKTSLEKKLGEGVFVDKAPPAVVEIERKRLAEAKQKLEKLQQQLASLK